VSQKHKMCLVQGFSLVSLKPERDENTLFRAACPPKKRLLAAYSLSRTQSLCGRSRLAFREHRTGLFEVRRAELGEDVHRALEALFGILAADRYTTLPDLLGDPTALLPQDVVTSLVGEAFNRLDTTAQRVMQALAIYGRPVASVAVDYLLQPYLPGVNRTPILHRLVNRHFVQRERGYLSLHPVDRSYARARVLRGVEDTPTAPVSGRQRPGAMSPPA
jgi:hypothetical protein